MAILKPCLVCHTLSPAARCPTHRLPSQPTQPAPPGSTTRRGYGAAWQKYARQQVTQWVATHGWNCPGWSRGSHESHDLVCDHDLGVMCRQCNSRKAATVDKQRARTRGGSQTQVAQGG